MTKRLISLFLTLVLLVVIPVSARYRYNPYTNKLDYYETGADIDFGDLADITFTALATGNVLYYNGTAWVNLATGANAEVLTLAGGVPTWAGGGVPAAHAASHEVGGADLVDHDQLTNYLAAQHLTLPNTLVAVLTDHNAATHVALGFLALPSTIAAVLTDHNLLAHTAMGLFDASGDVDHDLTTNYLAAQHLTLPSTIVAVLTDHDLAAHTALGLYDAPGDVDHDLTTNYVANQHIDHTAVTFSAAGLITGGGTLAADRTFTLTEATIEAAIDTLGAVQFTGDVEFLEDVFVTWADAGDHLMIEQQSAAGIEDQPLLRITDERSGVTVDELREATFVLNADGPAYALYIQDGESWFVKKTTFAGDTLQNEDVFITWADALDKMVIHQSAVAGTEDQPLIYINDDRVGVTVDEPSEATIYIDTAADRAIYISGGNGIELAGNAGVRVGGTVHVYGAQTFDEKWCIKWIGNAAEDELFRWRYYNYGANDTSAIFYSKNEPDGMPYFNDYESPTFVITNSEGADTNDFAGVVIGERAQANVAVAHYFDFFAMTGASDGVIDPTATEIGATFRFGDSGTTVPTYATGSGDVIFEDDIEVIGTSHFLGDTTQYEDVFVTWADALDHAVITQTDTTGTEDQPLIFIDDDRTGAAATEQSEATIRILAAGLYALSVEDGEVIISGGSKLVMDATHQTKDDRYHIWGTGNDWYQIWDLNGTGDDIWAWQINQAATSAIFISRLAPNNMTEHDNYLSPTFVLTNDEGADANDYAGVVIGERAQADVKIAHYFDFFAMTGASDGAVNPVNAELGATFRFGDSGSAVPNHATGPGDVLFEDDIEVDGVSYFGDATNYASFAVDGTLTLAGTAQVTLCHQFANAALGQGGTKPDTVIVGNYWGWSYDIADDSVFTYKLPDNWAAGTDVEIHIRWAVNEAYITNSGEVRWQATWSAHPANSTSAINDAGTTDDSGDINIPAIAYFLTQTLIETIPGGSLLAGDELGITIERIALVDGAGPVEDPIITCVGIIYTVDKLGT